MSEFKVGDKVRKVNGGTFINGCKTAFISKIINDEVLLNAGSVIKSVNLEKVEEAEPLHLDDPVKPGHYHKGGMDLFEFMVKQGRTDKLKGFLQTSVLKYTLRYEEKNGLEDLNKAKECLEKLIELEREKDAKA